jgi:restriction system protein
MCEIIVQHEGLNAYRVVRGASQQEAKLKADFQIAVWNERWSNRQATLKSRMQKLQKSCDKEANKQTARSRTEELQGQLHALETILADGLQQQKLKWQNLKDRAAYTVPCPPEPVAHPIPAEPDSSLFAPQLTLIDRVFKSLRAKKETVAAAELESEMKKWKSSCVKLDEARRANLLVYTVKIAEWTQAKKQQQIDQKQQHAQIDELYDEYKAGKASAVEYFLAEVLNRSVYPDGFPQGNTINFNEDSGVLIVDFELPNQSAFPTVKEVKYIATREEFQEVSVSDAWLKKMYDEVLYQIALRTIHELYIADESEVLKSIVFNGWVQSIDKATGAEAHGCILSVQAEREEFLQINLSQVEPKACFRKLKGIASSKLSELTPVRPILAINKEDHRFVDGYAVADTLDDRTNLAAMDWLDFENLIRELFEKEFSKNGGEVKITQASRDGGVDAIAFDPDPIRGGKIVIQAKRYTNVVGVSAVRDLYGTVLNEGANKGILVTTAAYGSDSYDFAKDKPLTLLGGGELLSLLATHGHPAKIDLQEAKALNLQREQNL